MGPGHRSLSSKGDPPGQVHTCHPHLWLAPAFEVLFVLACFEGWLVAAGSGGGGGRTGEHDAAPALFGPAGGSEAARQGHGEAVSAGMTFPPPTCEGRSESACVVPSTDRSWRLAVAPADRRRVTAETRERSPGTSPAVGWSHRDQLRLASPCSPAQSWRPLPAAQPTCWTSGRVGSSEGIPETTPDLPETLTKLQSPGRIPESLGFWGWDSRLCACRKNQP